LLSLKSKNFKLYLCLTKHHAMKTYWGGKVQIHSFLTLALDGYEWSASCFYRFTTGVRTPNPHWIGGWVGPRADFDAVAKRKILSLSLPGIESCYL